MARQALLAAQEVAAQTDYSEILIPANGEIVSFFEFWGNAAHSPNAVVCVVWDLDGAGEEIIWSTKGTLNREDISWLPTRTGDGVKKLALCLSNNTTGPLVLSGRLTVDVN